MACLWNSQARTQLSLSSALSLKLFSPHLGHFSVILRSYFLDHSLECNLLVFCVGVEGKSFVYYLTLGSPALLRALHLDLFFPLLSAPFWVSPSP